MSNSLWHIRATPLPERADRVVVGAGIAGISASLAFESLGLDTVVIDGRYPGWGASGRNAGFLMRGAADNYAAAVDDLGREHAKALWTLTENNLTRLRNLGIDQLPHYRPQPSCLVAFEKKEAEQLERSASLMAEDGFDVDTRRGQGEHADALWRYEAPRIGLVNPNDAVCDPVELLAWLCSLLKRMPIAETTLQRIEQTDAGFAVVTSRGTIMAEQVLICTNAYTASLLPDYARLIQPNRGQMLALDATGLPAHERLEFAYYANHGSEYFRQLDETTIIVGGWRRHFEHDERTLENQPTVGVQQGLESFAERVLGRRLPVRHRWAGTMGFTPDHLPIAGPLDMSDQTSPWICVGFTGHGMSMAHELATQTALAMSGRSEVPDLFRPGRFVDKTAGRIDR